VTYGIGVTTSGVQAFRYRGERELCVPGQMHILHPDETHDGTHDGTAATAAGFGYRIIYADPDLISAALGRRPCRSCPGRCTTTHRSTYWPCSTTSTNRSAAQQVTSAALELLAGLDRYAIARQFRRAYGTSPERYRIFRRLDLARAAMRAGTPLARAATDAGFADQSHFTRQFKRAYGLTPGRWATLSRWP
jgi:AraC-like DNA-binding protein